MFKSILSGLTSGSQGQGSASNTEPSKGTTPAQLRADIYSGMDAICMWIASGKTENGIDYRSILVSAVLPAEKTMKLRTGYRLGARK